MLAARDCVLFDTGLCRGAYAAEQPTGQGGNGRDPLLRAIYILNLHSEPVVLAARTASMTKIKTKHTGASVEDYIAARGNEQQRTDCHALMALLETITRQPAKMWGPSIVGHGSYRYTYESGHTGEAPLVGFAIRGRELVVYLSADDAGQRTLLSKLGKHKMGKSCLYFKRLADLDPSVLEQLVVGSIAAVRRRHG
jgi:hypothetical protein